nr:ParA family protein [Fredinandcohnia onubensis]
MSIVISFGIQKGGVGKTTVTGITSWLLSRLGKNVLAVDFDSQGNLTQFLTQRNIYDFSKKTVLEACKSKNAANFIHNISDGFDILPAEDLLATFSRFLYREYKGNPNTLLRDTLVTVKDQYDYILIDLPPNLGDQTINGLTASDFAVAMLQSEPFCLDALDRYIETLHHVQKNTNQNLVLLGILTSLSDRRTIIDAKIIEQARLDYEDIVFDTMIHRRSRIKEFSLTGIRDRTKNDQEALRDYMSFVEELVARVEKR